MGAAHVGAVVGMLFRCYAVPLGGAINGSAACLEREIGESLVVARLRAQGGDYILRTDSDRRWLAINGRAARQLVIKPQRSAAA